LGRLGWNARRRRLLERAAKLWRDRVRDGELGEHPYTIAPDELARLQQLAGHVS
jgi:hypothetical protein